MHRIRSSIGAVGCCLALSLGLLLFANASAQQGWSVQQFTAENGLPQNSVVSLAFDTSGYLWLTTEGGLVRYDGHAMRLFSTSNDTDLLDDRMRYLLPDGSGGLFVNDAIGSLYRVTTGDVHRILDGRTTDHATLSGGFPSLELYHELTRTDLPADRRRSRDMRIMPLPEGGVALRTNVGIELIGAGGDVRSIPLGTGQQLAYLLDDDLYVLGLDKVLYRVDRRNATLRAVVVVGVELQDVDRFLWSSTSAGVFALGGDRSWRVSRRTDGSVAFEELTIELPRNTRVNAMLLLPDERTLLVGTSTQGLLRYTRHRFRTLRPLPGTREGQDNSFYAQALLDDGRVLAANGMICGPAGFEPELYPLSPAQSHVLHRDRKGRIWSTRIGTLQVHDARSSAKLFEKATSVGTVTAFLEEQDTLWVAGIDGSEAWVDDSPHPMVKLRSRSYRDVPFALLRGPDGRLWWASGQGVFHVIGEELEPVQGLERVYARTLALWRGRVLLGTYGDGPMVVDHGKVIHLPLDPKGALSHVHAFIPDGKGRIWMPTNHGLFVVREGALEAFLTDPRYGLTYDSFGHNDGLATLEFNGGCSPPYVMLPSGELSLPTIDGLVRFDPGAVEDDPERFQPFLDGVQRNDSLTMPGATSLVLAPSDRLALQYALPCWTDPGNLQLYYRVLGLDTAWVRMDMASDRIVVERLPPGSYTLQMMRPGAEVSVRDLLRIQVLTPWYRSVWTMVLGLCLIFGLGWLVVYVRTGRLVGAQARLEAIVAERTKELQRSNVELTRALGVKDRLISILSHDIVSPLRFISRVAARTLRSARSEKPEVLRHTLSEISSSSEKLYANASNILEWIRNQGGEIAVVPAEVEMRVLTEEVLAQFQQHSTTVHFVNEVPPNTYLWIDPRLFGIVLQNLVSNAAGHAGGLVTVEGQRLPGGYRVSVKDNGPGMSAAAQQRINALREGVAEVRAATDRPGLGYMIIHDILALLGGDYQIETPPSGGTWVHVFLRERATEHTVEAPPS